jgi:hypothetical protein
MNHQHTTKHKAARTTTTRIITQQQQQQHTTTININNTNRNKSSKHINKSSNQSKVQPTFNTQINSVRPNQQQWNHICQTLSTGTCVACIGCWYCLICFLFSSWFGLCVFVFVASYYQANKHTHTQKQSHKQFDKTTKTIATKFCYLCLFLETTLG